MKNKQDKYEEMVNKGLDLGILKDIVKLMEGTDKIKKTMAITLTKKFLDGYSVPNNGLVVAIAEALNRVYLKHGEKSSSVILNSMFEVLNERRYAVGVAEFIARLEKA